MAFKLKYTQVAQGHLFALKNDSSKHRILKDI